MRCVAFLQQVQGLLKCRDLVEVPAYASNCKEEVHYHITRFKIAVCTTREDMHNVTPTLSALRVWPRLEQDSCRLSACRKCQLRRLARLCCAGPTCAGASVLADSSWAGSMPVMMDTK